jgi:hypothetical protein
MKTTVFALLLLSTLATPAAAQSFNLSKITCKEVMTLASTNGDDFASVIIWAEGWVHGYEGTTTGVYDGFETDMDSLGQLCSEFPEKDFLTVWNALRKNPAQ